ncbi:unnamed protein product [Caenorhabditis brenneri]
MSSPPANAPPLHKPAIVTEASSLYSCLFFKFLITIPPSQRQRMFQKPSCVFDIYRMLPLTTQQVTIQLIWKV